jgi:hypothetical protein
MVKKTQSQKKSRVRKDGENRDAVSKKIRVHELLEKTIATFESKIMNSDYEPTVAEYIKLLQLGREIGQEDEPKEIKVTWVVPNSTSESET